VAPLTEPFANMIFELALAGLIAAQKASRTVDVFKQRFNLTQFALKPAPPTIGEDASGFLLSSALPLSEWTTVGIHAPSRTSTARFPLRELKDRRRA
jgi:hypothetical protein